MFLARRPAAFLIAALLSPLAPGAARDEPDWGEPAETVTLTGVVRTAGGNPAPGVAVTARGVSNVAGVEPRYGEPQTVTADEDGAFTFEAVPAAEGYQLTTPETPAGVGHGLVRTGEAGEPAAVTVRPAGPLRLAVTNPDGSPAAGTRAVLLTGVAGGRQYGLLLPPDAPPAGDDGVLTIPGVWRGAEVTALLRAPGGRRQSAGPFVVPDDAEPGDDADPEPVTLAPGGTLIVRAEPTPGGAPLPAAGYSLIVADDSRDLLTQIRDDAATFAVGDDGAATLTLAVPADGGSPFAPALEVGADAAEPAEAEVEAALGWPSVVNVLLSHPDVTLTPTARTVEVAAGETVAAVFNAIETATITGRIVDERGEPLAPSEASYPSVIPFVKVAENAEGAGAFPDVGAGPGWEMAVLPQDLPPVGDDGRFAVPAPPGAVKVTVADNAGGRFGAVRELTLTADGADLGDVVLPPLPALTGAVVGEDGRPVAGALVRSGGEYGGHFQAVVTDADGRFEAPLESLPPGAAFGGGESGDGDGGEPVTLTVLAFDPRAARQGEADVELTPGGEMEGKMEPVTLTLSPEEVPAPPEPPPKWRDRAEPGTPEFGAAGPELAVSHTLTAAGEAAAEPLTLASLRGRWVLLDFTATWCGPCRAEAKTVAATADAFSDRLTVVAVHHTSDSAEEIRDLLTEEGHPAAGPAVRDADGDRTQTAYGVRGFPTRILLDPEGRIAGGGSYSAGFRGAKLPATVRAFLAAEDAAGDADPASSPPRGTGK